MIESVDFDTYFLRHRYKVKNTGLILPGPVRGPVKEENLRAVLQCAVKQIAGYFLKAGNKFCKGFIRFLRWKVKKKDVSG